MCIRDRASTDLKFPRDDAVSVSETVRLLSYLENLVGVVDVRKGQCDEQTEGRSSQ